MAVWPDGGTSVPRVSSEFSLSRRNPVTGIIQPHRGIDLVGWSTIRAAEAGTIIYAGYNGSAGNEVRLRGDSGTVYRYLHNSRFLRTGGRVAQGEGIAIMGTTGQSSGVHCHWETKPGGGTAINPRDFMRGNTGGAPANVAGGQRTTKAVVNGRAQPTSKSALSGEPLQPGTVGNFVGWVRGENVEGNDVWYKGTSGRWFWSGGFHEGANGTGIEDLNPKVLLPYQRRVGSGGVNGRSEARPDATWKQTLNPGEVGDFKGFVRGAAVEGNSIWFVGLHSGDMFWSGGFEGGANTANLADLTPQSIPANGRRVGSDGVNLRVAADPASERKGFMDPGTVHTFDGFVRGATVDGNGIWFKHDTTKNFAWSGGFEGGANTAGLPDLTSGTQNPTPQPASTKRTTRVPSLNGRSGPSTKFPVRQSLDAMGTEGEFNGWAKGESVTLDGVTSDIWFRGAIAGNYFAAAGFTSQSTDGLSEVKDSPSEPPAGGATSRFNPLGLPTYKPVNPKALIGIVSPYTKDADRGFKGIPPVAVGEKVIDRGVLHYTSNDGEEGNARYFSGENDRGSCPTWFVAKDGQRAEYIRPGLKPAATGKEMNYRSVAWEVLTSGIATDAQLEAIAEDLATLASYDGKMWDGVAVRFKLDREHFVYHGEVIPGTECPGTFLISKMDSILARAKVILKEMQNGTTPTPNPEPETPADGEDVTVKRSWLQKLLDDIKKALGGK